MTLKDEAVSEPVAGSTSAHPPHKCSICKEVGHNAVTCKNRKSPEAKTLIKKQTKKIKKAKWHARWTDAENALVHAGLRKEEQSAKKEGRKIRQANVISNVVKMLKTKGIKKSPAAVEHRIARMLKREAKQNPSVRAIGSDAPVSVLSPSEAESILFADATRAAERIVSSGVAQVLRRDYIAKIYGMRVVERLRQMGSGVSS